MTRANGILILANFSNSAVMAINSACKQNLMKDFNNKYN